MATRQRFVNFFLHKLSFRLPLVVSGKSAFFFRKSFQFVRFWKNDKFKFIGKAYWRGENQTLKNQPHFISFWNRMIPADFKWKKERLKSSRKIIWKTFDSEQFRWWSRKDELLISWTDCNVWVRPFFQKHLSKTFVVAFRDSGLFLIPWKKYNISGWEIDS